MNVRPLEERDFDNGFLETLSSYDDSLAKWDHTDAKQLYAKLNEEKNRTVLVGILDDRVVSTATIFLETKYLHRGGLIGRIEDVATHNDFQGLGLGRKVVLYLLKHAKESGCYKTILDCTMNLVNFYINCGFRPKEIEMRFDHFEKKKL